MDEAEELIKKLQTEGKLVLYNTTTGSLRKRTLVLNPDNPRRCKVIYMDDVFAQNDFLITEFVPRLIRYGEAQPNYWLAYAETLKAKAKAND